MRKDEQKDGQDDTVSTFDAIVLIGLLLSCCLLPMALSGLAFVSAWLAFAEPLQPYRPLLLTSAVLSILLAFKKIYYPRQSGAAGNPAGGKRAGFGTHVLFWLLTAASLSIFGAPFF